MPDPAEAMLRGALDYTVSQVEPDFSRLSEALGVELDAGSFAMGMLTVAFLMKGMNALEICAGPYGHLVREFIDNCRKESERA